MSDDVWTPREGELVADRFRLVRELDRGGMGSVWLAQHVGLEVPCALKFIHEDAQVTDEHRSRFRQEALAAARLKSRFVVQMLDHGVWKDAPYIAMELLEGELLSTRLRHVGKLNPAQTLDVVRGVARALASAADLGIVHRDLKPENIFLVNEGGDEYPKVLDFGVAKLTQPELGGSHRTKTGALIGTPWYMSPEQIDGTLAVDLRSDLWALSIITYQCLTGELPFQSAALGNLMLKIVNGPRPLPSEIAPDLPKTFDAWWLRAAEREPEARFQTADEWLLALEQSLSIEHREVRDERTVDEPATEPAEAIAPAAPSDPPASASTDATFAGQARSSAKKAPSGKLARAGLVALLSMIAAASMVLLFWRREETEPFVPSAPSPPAASTADSEVPGWRPPSGGPAVEPWLSESAEAEPSASAAVEERPDAGADAGPPVPPPKATASASAPPPLPSAAPSAPAPPSAPPAP